MFSTPAVNVKSEENKFKETKGHQQKREYSFQLKNKIILDVFPSNYKLRAIRFAFVLKSTDFHQNFKK